ncbi:MAG: hypothetical protein KDD73_09125 [Anaerolineales bacterium]|nr:hypothetical protein [Anaerolineales bacterium]MCB9129178.1 hypothetical protein [Ardenticatenales bacterium]
MSEHRKAEESEERGASAPVDEGSQSGHNGFDEAAESEMMRRLRDLGYVE